jgi:DNA-binding transcriptional LysR family regulator
MELMQLQMVVAVAEEGNLQKAAGRVYRTAPAISIAISKLERELEVVLFDRSASREFRLTAAGEVLLDYARRLVALRDEAMAAVEQIRNVKRGSLCIGANESIGDYLLPQLTKTFQEQYPGVTLEVEITHSDSLLSALKRHELDVALVAYEPGDEDLEAQMFMRDTLVAIMRPGHRLAALDQITITDLRRESLIIENAASSLRPRIAEAFERSQIPMKVNVETGTIASIKNMVENGMGVGIVPRVCVRKEEAGGELVVKDLAEFEDERTLWVVRRRGLATSPASEAFLKVIRSAETNLKSNTLHVK